MPCPRTVEGVHVWYSDLRPSRITVFDWCVACSEPRPMTPATEETRHAAHASPPE